MFRDPGAPGHNSIARIIGLPGDTITIVDTDVQINGIQLNEPYVTEKSNYLIRPFQSGKVPNGEYLALGDNRPLSVDSRIWGFLPKSNIIGQVFIVIWPLNQIQIIDNYPAVYSHIK